MSNFWGAHQNRAMAHICIADSHARAGLLCASLARQAAAVRLRLRRSTSPFEFDFDKV